MGSFGFMLASALVTLGISVVGFLGVVLMCLFMDWYTRTPFDRLIRERERHARRTARAMRRMSEIRRQTIERMDRAEREGWR